MRIEYKVSEEFPANSVFWCFRLFSRVWKVAIFWTASGWRMDSDFGPSKVWQGFFRTIRPNYTFHAVIFLWFLFSVGISKPETKDSDAKQV